jgi:nitrogen fixation-related uncharacterized protein
MKFAVFSLVCAGVYFFFWGIGKLIDRHEKKQKEESARPKLLG